MGLSQAMYSAISGLVNHQRSMDNIGNNLANVNTVGFKKGVFQFRTLLEQILRGGTAADSQTQRGAINPISMGLGTQIGSINHDFRQGSMEVTGNQRDMAIEGNGFFVLRNQNSYVYSRDGTFYLGTDGTLLANNGFQVQGVMAEQGVVPTAGDVGDIIIPIGVTGAARETTAVTFGGNLNSDQEVCSGIKLVGDDGTGQPLIPPAGNFDGTREYLGATTVDTTWAVLAAASAGNERIINGGTVQTTSPLAVFVGPGYAAANLNTPLEDLYYLSGTTWLQPFRNIDTNVDKDITINFRKGGRLYTATFTYNPAGSATPSNTLQDLITFLAGAVDDFATITDVDAIEAETTRILRNTGIMGLTKIAGKVSTSHRDVLPGATGDSAYDVPIETAGAFTRSYDGIVDYDGDGVPEAAGANPGIPDAGSGDSFNISIVSNLGAENAITDIEIIYNNVKYSDFFKPDIAYSQIQGGSDSTNLVAYDSLGNPKRLNLQMSLVARDTNFSTWRWIADSQDDTDADFQFNNAGTAITTSLNVGTGVIRFDAEGRFVSGTEFSESDGIEITLDNQGVNSPLTIRLRRGLATGETQDLNFSPITQVAAESDFNLKSQDGTPPGTLDSFTVTADGVIQGIFSNGVVEPIARLVLALVPNETGLLSIGNNLFLEGPASGEAAINFAATGGRGWIRAGQLESSNVDLSEEFTKLITTQRGFQANARVITTSDEMLVELVNMKR